MRDVHQIELFYFGDTTSPRRSLTSMSHGNQFRTRIGFTTPDGLDVAGNLELESAGSVLEWSSFTFHGDGRTVTAERTSDGVNVAGNFMSLSGPALPGYACLLLVLDLVDSNHERIDFTWLTETADNPARPASLQLKPNDMVSSPVRGNVEDCRRVELTVSGERTNTYWVKDGEVIASDWARTQSFALPREVVRSLSQ
ncbi:hypothetical protein [Flaviflexus massiliensis]|uniref:hypothetical protein n=1 Tax=Flaviflexus massiliensis TaxID=1522309 RepID=UPI0006D59CE0|nr:hypothetical protein [Flaviflexus massiliensis]